MKLIAKYLILLGLCSCGTPFKKEINQDLATYLVWNEVYEQRSMPPNIEWIEGDLLNCYMGTGYNSYYNENGQFVTGCVAGTFYEDQHLIKLAKPPGSEYHDIAFSHELNHARLYFTTGDGDGNHIGISWQVNGLMDQANDKLKEAGL